MQIKSCRLFSGYRSYYFQAKNFSINYTGQHKFSLEKVICETYKFRAPEYETVFSFSLSSIVFEIWAFIEFPFLVRYRYTAYNDRVCIGKTIRARK